MSNRHDFPTPTQSVGVGLKPAHYKEALAGTSGIDFFEVHAENFLGEGGPPHRWLTAFRADFPISLHGVFLSIGGRDDLDCEHLRRLAELSNRYNPALISEHLAWSADDGVYYNDLLPPPMTVSSLARVARHIDQTQEALGRRILIENPSRYLSLEGNDIPEPEFLNELARRTGCGVLLDLNNVFVSAMNLHFDADRYLTSMDASHIGEIHLAGHALDAFDGVEVRVDNHGSKVCDEVLALYGAFIERAGPRPTLIEWDTNLPAFEVLAGEARRASDVMRRAVSSGEIHDAA